MQNLSGGSGPLALIFFVSYGLGVAPKLTHSATLVLHDFPIFELPHKLHAMPVSVWEWLRSSLLPVTQWLNFSSWALPLLGRFTEEETSEHEVGASSKRKFSEQLREEAEVDEEEKEGGGKEVKRLRGDTIFIAVQDFIAKMWGGAAAVEDGSVESELENKDNVDEQFWKQQPHFDFLPSKVQVKFGENTPSRAIKELEGKVASEPEQVPAC